MVITWSGLPLLLLLSALVTAANATTTAPAPGGGTETGCTTEVSSALALIRSALPKATDTSRCEAQNGTLEAAPSPTATTLTLDPEQFPIVEHHSFYGLASYYNGVRMLEVSDTGVSTLEQGQSLALDEQHLLAAVGRFSALLIDAPGANASMVDEQLRLSWPPSTPIALGITVSDKPGLAANPVWSHIRYSHLWDWMASLSTLVEWALVTIHGRLIDNWGWTIVIFSVLLKLLLLPVGIMTTRFQGQVSRHQAALAPQLTEIKAHYDGEQAHQRIMAAHKALGISPFYTLKPMLGSLIQVPILVAVFNALGEMPQLAGAPFLWITDLAYPDAIATLPTAIPMFGDKLSLLPIIMTVVTIFSTLIFQNRHAPAAELKRQKRNLYLMAAAFLVLFYPFPAAMVLYWTLANLLQTIQQQLIRI